ncbi:MAG: Lar family restriction alleviation protein [Prevotella sp.]
MTKELKPCPYCGEPGTFHIYGMHFKVQCDNVLCPARPIVPPPGKFFTNKAAAAEAWNHRAKEIVHCQECTHQVKIWHSDKRMKDGGYWVFGCKLNSDPFVAHVVDGVDGEFCSHGEPKNKEDK